MTFIQYAQSTYPASRPPRRPSHRRVPPPCAALFPCRSALAARMGAAHSDRLATNEVDGTVAAIVKIQAFWRGCLARRDFSSELCGICLVGFLPRDMKDYPSSCGHRFCGNCTFSWLSRSRTNACPTCRASCDARTAQEIVDLCRLRRTVDAYTSRPVEIAVSTLSQEMARELAHLERLREYKRSWISLIASPWSRSPARDPNHQDDGAAATARQPAVERRTPPPRGFSSDGCAADKSSPRHHAR